MPKYETGELWIKGRVAWENSENVGAANTYRIIQSIDVQHHRFGPFVAGAQKEMSFPLAGGGLPFGSRGFFVTSRLQNLIDLRG